MEVLEYLKIYVRTFLLYLKIILKYIGWLFWTEHTSDV